MVRPGSELAGQRKPSPQGHSLPELIITIVLLSACLGAVCSSAILGSRWTSRGIARQAAAILARDVVDSLMTADPIMAGERRRGHTVAKWTVSPLSAANSEVQLVEVRVATPGLEPAVLLTATWLPPAPSWPGP